ncbi:serine/threonine protein kinase [Kribbella voronezhensis]|uniref:Serine/threonine protein kinase n=2 Tax=Kribbella voronezhensis TaxID=2512212 RepID=A0A4R7TDR4_9ACTN|nr:serine/threonine protein kinase [Kribbella voronezhensis]
MDEQIGPYKLLRRLGQGGMGVVYLAEGPVHKEVALKVLRPHVAHDPTARARLEREATTLQKVNHPGVAGILDHDLRGDRPYLVTRFIPGRPLDEQVDERGPLTPQRWLPLAGCLAESLQAIHQAGVIHRDLKPGNVMMFNGKPVMIDFGIAQAADDLRLTQTGLVIGTPGYLAPELIEGEMVSESADWWGWAATVAYAATGRRPFGKGPFEVVLHRVHTGKADLEGLDPRLKPLLAAALSPDRRDRPTQLEIMTGLNRYAEGRDALIPDPTVEAAAQEAAEVNPPTAVMTRVMPEDAVAATAVAGHDPAEVASLVPSVIPPLSAFTPLRDKLRDVAAQQKAKAATPAPIHPATYSPAPVAAAPPALPLGAQGPAYGGYPGQGVAPYQPAYPQTSYQPQPQFYQPQPEPQYQPEPYRGHQPPGQSVVPKQPAGDAAAPANQQVARTVLLAALMLALSGLMALYPGLGLLVTTLLLVFARTVDRGSTALMRRRQVRGGRGKSDGVIAIAASPVHLMAASLITLFCLILPVIVGFIVGGIVTAGAANSHGTGWEPLSAVGFGTGGVAGLLAAWWGPGGSSLRRGAKITLRSAVRPAWLSLLVAVLLVVAAVAAFSGASNGSGSRWARTAIHVPSASQLTDVRGYPLIRDLPIIGNNR